MNRDPRPKKRTRGSACTTPRSEQSTHLAGIPVCHRQPDVPSYHLWGSVWEVCREESGQASQSTLQGPSEITGPVAPGCHGAEKCNPELAAMITDNGQAALRAVAHKCGYPEGLWLWGRQCAEPRVTQGPGRGRPPPPSCSCGFNSRDCASWQHLLALHRDLRWGYWGHIWALPLSIGGYHGHT